MPQYLGPISATFDASLSFEKVLGGSSGNPNFKLYPSFAVNGALEDSSVMKVNWGPKQFTKLTGIDFTEDLANSSDVKVKLKKQITNDANLIVSFDNTSATTAELVINTTDSNVLKFGVQTPKMNLGGTGLNNLCDPSLKFFGSFSTDLASLPVNLGCYPCNTANTKVTLGYDCLGLGANLTDSQFYVGLLNVQNSNEECLKELQKYTYEDFKENKDCLPQTQISGGKLKFKPTQILQGWELDLYSLSDMQNGGEYMVSPDQNMNFVCSMTIKETEKNYLNDNKNGGIGTENPNKITLNYINFNSEVRRCLNDSTTDYMGFNFVSSDDTWLKATVGCRTDFEGFSGFFGEDPSKTQSCFGTAFTNIPTSQ